MARKQPRHRTREERKKKRKGNNALIDCIKNDNTHPRVHLGKVFAVKRRPQKAIITPVALV